MSFIRSAVSAVIEDSAGRVLLCQQRQGHRLWSLPGGRTRVDESPVDAVIRDIREESGIEARVVDLVGLYHLTGDGCGEGVPDLYVHVFRATLVAGEAALNAPGRICRLAWWEPHELPEPLTATTRTAILDATAGRSGVVQDVERDAEPEIPEAVDTDTPTVTR
ncbi:MAG: NUDIX hydrolase [Dactylosporangium sp.]|nr:NUDIX hydrolase [Dactylosporangium sp.]NNJ59470.1 NUDIX hydrolase [Dactylosporangium sp.]